MKLHRIHLKNLRVHADTDVPIPESGITGVVGSNEAGKSTLAIEAPGWALFGSKAIRGTKDSLRWNRAPARHVAAVELEFSVGGKRYRIERTETDAKLFQGETPIAEGTSAVDEYVPTLVGMAWPEFAASFLCQQKDLNRLASMGPTERQTFVRGVMGLDRIDAALKAVRERKNELGRELAGMEAGLGDRAPLVEEEKQAQERVDFLADQVQDLKAATAELESEYEDAAGRLTALDQNNERHDQLAAELENIGREIDRLKTVREERARDAVERQQAEHRIRDAEPKLERLGELRARRDQLISARERADQREQLQETIARLEEDVAGLSRELEEAKADVAGHDEAALEAVAGRYTELRDRYREMAEARGARAAEAKAEREAANRRVREIREQVETLRTAGSDGACPTCTRPLQDVFEATVAALEDQAAHFDAEAKDAAGRELKAMDPDDAEQRLASEVDDLRRRGEQLKEARTRAREAERRVASLRMRLEQKQNEFGRRRERLASMEAVEYSADALREVEAVISDLEALEKRVAADRATVERLDGVDGRVQATDEEIEAARARHARTADAIHALAYDLDHHAEVRQEADHARARLEQGRQDLAAAKERGKAEEERLARARQQLVAYDQRAESLTDTREDLRVHTAAAERLDAFRVEQASLIRPELEELTSGFISILTDGRHDSVTVTEDFAVILQEAGLDTEVISGGTEDLAALALRLAMSQMIAERAGHPLSLLVLDEPFGSLDEVRRGNVLNLIRRLSGVFEQVLVISHVAETKDAVDHVIELTYDEPAGRSRLVGATAAATEPVEAAA